jgi:nucleosome assembly protein 1-like 1
LEDEGYEKEYTTLKGGFDTQYRELYDEISKIVRGENFPSITDEEKKTYEISADAPESEKGITDYWSTALLNAAYFPINEKDEKVLKHLVDVRIKADEAISQNFVVEFLFSENEFFTPTVLTKTFFFNAESDEIEKTQGTQIQWTSQEKNPRVEIKTKKVKKGKNVETKKIESIVPSFFDIFADQTKDDPMAADESNFWRDDFFANSLEYYLNIIDNEDFLGEDEEDEEDEDDEDDEEVAKKGKKSKGVKLPAGGDAAKNEKCKNQ